MVISKAYQLKREDVKKWAYNAFIFAIPALLVLIASFKDIIPVDASWGVLALYALNLIADILRKYVGENKYK